jgi:hypothetical protein
MNKLDGNSTCFVCNKKADGYIVIEGRDENRKTRRKVEIFLCSNHMREWTDNELDDLIIQIIKKGRNEWFIK